MPRRKPVPNLSDDHNVNEQQQSYEQLPPLPQQSTFADPQLRRYTLTDGPTTPGSTRTFNSEQDEISQAVDQLLQNRYSAVADINDQRSEAAPSLVRDGQSLSRRSSGSNGTVTDLRERAEGSEDSHGSGSTVTEGPIQMPQRAPTVPPYQPGQLLPTIVTGETLNIDEYGQQIPPADADPFSDTQALPHVPLPTTQPYAHYDQHYADPDQLPSPPPPIHHDDGFQYMPPQDPNQLYQQIEPEPLLAGSGDFVDHFRHDTEAYASGNYSRASFRPPRSRSPTPGIDDEDYHIVGQDEVHYTGYPGMEETPPYPQYDHNGYLNEKYADAFGQDVLYDDGEKTPVSTVSHLDPDPDLPLETRHFGPAPTGRVHRRHKSKKRVQLTNGNLVVDINVPPKMVLPYRGEPEMNTTRYTAITCDPDDFEKNGFFLRQNESGRRTELFIVITMFNVSRLVSYTCDAELMRSRISGR